jgi:hypothetical protein
MLSARYKLECDEVPPAHCGHVGIVSIGHTVCSYGSSATFLVFMYLYLSVVPKATVITSSFSGLSRTLGLVLVPLLPWLPQSMLIRCDAP